MLCTKYAADKDPRLTRLIFLFNADSHHYAFQAKPVTGALVKEDIFNPGCICPGMAIN
jgi:hypothetical protein